MANQDAHDDPLEDALNDVADQYRVYEHLGEIAAVTATVNASWTSDSIEFSSGPSPMSLTFYPSSKSIFGQA